MSISPLHFDTPCLLWQVDLDAPPEPAYVACLSEAEWDRARRFVFRRDRERFVAAHAALRQILSIRSGISAALLEFDQGEFGKPSLVGQADLRFNLSHSQSVALIAVHEEADVGVDVEVLRPMPDALALAATCFTPDEIRFLQALPSDARDHAFLVGWTRKEACLKSLGLGLSADPTCLEVGLEIAPRRVRYTAEDRVQLMRVMSVPLGAGMVGALAFETEATQAAVARTNPAALEILR